MADGLGPAGGELQTLVSTLNNLVIGIGNIVKQMTMIFPAGTATSATAGSNGDVPAQVDGYLVVTIPGVGTRKVPYYKV